MVYQDKIFTPLTSEDVPAAPGEAEEKKEGEGEEEKKEGEGEEEKKEGEGEEE